MPLESRCCRSSARQPGAMERHPYPLVQTPPRSREADRRGFLFDRARECAPKCSNRSQLSEMRAEHRAFSS